MVTPSQFEVKAESRGPNRASASGFLPWSAWSMSRFVSLLLLLLLHMHLFALCSQSNLRQFNLRGRSAALVSERDEINIELDKLISLEQVRIAARKEGMTKATIGDTDLHDLPEDIVSVSAVKERPQFR